MYQFPFLLLTADDVRNSNIADMLDDELTDFIRARKEFLSTLPDDIPARPLHDLLSIQTSMGSILSEVFKSNMNVLTSNLPEIDLWRIKERVKRLLTMLRRKSADLQNPFSDFAFSDKVKKTELWEDNDCIYDGKPENWNTLVLNRISDIHHHVHRFTEEMEQRVLVCNQSLRASDIGEKEREAMNLIGKITEATRYIYKEVKDYIRLIDSL